ncbi:MAG: AAA family ATPase [Ardenticatenaceae bacterium]|nr:AAA family ATPase [Ardenticatenaceae bacterium]
MFDSLLPTKLYLPATRSDCIDRPRLLKKIGSKRPFKLLLVSAPAGYGKTTFVTTWLQQLERVAVCWLSLDEDDSDPQQFFRYLAAAVRPLPGIQTALPHLLQSNQSIPGKTLAKTFVQDVVQVSDPFCLILDDYHAIDSAEIDAALATLLELMPPQMTLALISRSDPGFPISRLRARGQLIELRADDLRFTELEAAQFLQQTMGLTLQPKQIAALESRTEGWIAGLQMAALSMQNRASGDLDGFVHNFTGSHRFIMDYLTDEVLAQVAPEVQTFLLQTAVLHRLNADLCDAVLTEPPSSIAHRPSQQILEQLETANTFLISLDDERRWYRYHHLFADLLRQKVATATAQAIRQKAAVWSAKNGLTADAIEYALAAEDWETAVPLLVEQGLNYVFQGKLTRLRRWYDTLPRNLLLQQPRMCLDYAWVLVNQGEKGAVESYLLAAETAADGAPDIRAVTAIIRANNARAFENLAVMRSEAALALELTPPDRAVARCTALLQLGVAHLMAADDGLETAVATLQETSLLAKQSRNMNTALLAGGYLGLAHLLQKNVAAATAVLHETQTFAANQGLQQSPLLAYAHLGLAHLAFLDMDWPTARHEIEQVQAHSRFAEEPSALFRSGLLLALVERAAGNSAGIEKAMQAVMDTAVFLKTPEISQQIAFFQDVLWQAKPTAAQLETAQRLAAGASLSFAQSTTPLEPPTQPLIDPLSERELEILTLIAAGLKNKEIAERLIISLNTVLYHNKNIYSKLGVSKRALAIAKAKELSLI